MDDARTRGLTDEQVLAAATSSLGVFIEAGPGTGKTTVSAHRFGALRYSSTARTDPRAVVAVSFTRAATWNLRRRVRRFYGPTAMDWPHRVVTLDTIMVELLRHLLVTEQVIWPGQEGVLKVEDSWSVLGETVWSRQTYRMTLTDGVVGAEVTFADQPRQRPKVRTIGNKLAGGTCTHEDVRALVALALETASSREALRLRLTATIRALIVDECFDANDLDIEILRLARQAGIDVTLVGDPWQALYLFRGARPEVVRRLITEERLRVLPLNQSFRWESEIQADLAELLRGGNGVALETFPADAVANEDVRVVLATEWRPLWDLGAQVLPLAFHGFKGTAPEAVATILLDHVTRSVLGERAIYLNDSLTALAIDGADVVRELDDPLGRVLEMLQTPGRPAASVAWTELARVIGTVSPRHIPPPHWRYTDRLQLVAARLAHQHLPVPGLTTHQAKGREWTTVGLRITAPQRTLLAHGLRVDDDTSRKLYVAATRARRRTLVIEEPLA